MEEFPIAITFALCVRKYCTCIYLDASYYVLSSCSAMGRMLSITKQPPSAIFPLPVTSFKFACYETTLHEIIDGKLGLFSLSMFCLNTLKALQLAVVCRICATCGRQLHTKGSSTINITRLYVTYYLANQTVQSECWPVQEILFCLLHSTSVLEGVLVWFHD